MGQQDWLDKDYYAILGVKKNATPADIKKAFRKLARDNHPDQNKDPQAEKRFKEATEANDILSDADKRKEYDEARSLFGSGGFRMPGSAGGRPGFSQGQGINLDDLFGATGGAGAGIGDIFGNLFSGASGASSRGSRRGQDVEAEANLSFRDAAHGSTVSLRLTSETACDVCHGTGAKAGTSPKVCPTCQGSGMTARSSGGFASQPCGTCHGRGLVIDNPCPVCRGTGRGDSNRTIQVRIPAGVTNGQRIRIKGKGGPGSNGGAAGDLYVLAHVTPDKLFSRNGKNLAVTVPVTYAEATLGAAIDVPTLDGGRFTLKIPEGTKSGRTFRAKGKGIESKSGHTDLLVTVDVVVPPHLSDEAKAALETYASLAQEGNPRDGLWTGV